MNNDNDITFTLDTSSADDTITIDTSGFDSMMHGQSTFNIGSIDDDFDVSTLTFNDPIEFEDVLSSMSKIICMNFFIFFMLFLSCNSVFCNRSSD